MALLRYDGSLALVDGLEEVPLLAQHGISGQELIPLELLQLIAEVKVRVDALAAHHREQSHDSTDDATAAMDHHSNEQYLHFNFVFE